MKKILSLLCAFCIIASTASCAENAEINNEPAADLNETVAVTENPDTATGKSSEAVTSSVSESSDIVVFTTEGYAETSTATEMPVTEETEVISEAFTPAYDPGMPEVWLNLITTEIYSDTKTITFSVNSENEFITDNRVEIQMKTENGWETYRMNYGSRSYFDNIVVNKDNPLVIDLTIDYFYSEERTGSGDDKLYLSRGTEYRIVKEVNGTEYETFFAVGARIPPLEKDDIKLTIEEGMNFTTKDESLTLKYEYVGDAEYAEYGFGCDYTLEKLDESGEWENVPFSENACFIDLGYLISTDYPTNSTTVSLKDDFYAEPLTEGTYKIVKPIENDIVLTALFRINDRYGFNPDPADGDIRISIRELENNTPITTESKAITLDIEYTADYDYGSFNTGDMYQLEKYENSEWRTVKFNDDIGWHLTADIISEEYPVHSYNINLQSGIFYAEPITAGKYRVVKEISAKKFYAEFEITENPAELYEESGSLTLTINEITDEGFVCSLPWPSPAVYTVKCDVKDYDNFCVGDTVEVSYAPMYRLGEWDFTLIPTSITMSTFTLQTDACYKPVIYLYPEEQTDVSVKLDFNGELTVTYPEYNNGWKVTAMPDGTLFDENGNEYSYLFWEGESDIEYDFSKGFCVKGEDTVEFLRNALSALGLTPREYNEFIVFWLPFMQDNQYNVISFQTDSYTDNAILSVTPEPDTVLRVFMAFKPSNNPVDIEPQELKSTERNGFTVVEWGGAVVK